MSVHLKRCSDSNPFHIIVLPNVKCLSIRNSHVNCVKHGLYDNTNRHRHQRCKAPRLCKTFFITSNCRLKEAGKKKYLSHNVFLSTPFSHRSSHNVFFTMSFSQHNVFLTTPYSQRLSHNSFLTLLPLDIRPHNVDLTTSQYSRILLCCTNI